MNCDLCERPTDASIPVTIYLDLSQVNSYKSAPPLSYEGGWVSYVCKDCYSKEVKQYLKGRLVSRLH